MQRYNSNSNVETLVLTALMTALVLVATSFIKVPTFFTKGYVHLGDSMVFLSVLLLGRRNGALAGGAGSALADVLGGYSYFAPWTLVIKFLMAYSMGLFIDLADSRNPERRKGASLSAFDVIGMVIGGVVMVVGYAVAERIMYGNWAAPLAEVPWNAGQFAVGMVLASVLAAALVKTPARKYFAAHGYTANN
ncbi:MAG: ECF transporter S component [Eubacteriales bacterium]|nr:ECF transporter S component [Eubacteriales bacterium]